MSVTAVTGGGIGSSLGVRRVMGPEPRGWHRGVFAFLSVSDLFENVCGCSTLWSVLVQVSALSMSICLGWGQAGGVCMPCLLRFFECFWPVQKFIWVLFCLVSVGIMSRGLLLCLGKAEGVCWSHLLRFFSVSGPVLKFMWVSYCLRTVCTNCSSVWDNVP